MKHIAYIGLGSNIEPEINLVRAVQALQKRTRLRAVSSAWRSPSVGSTGPDFLNAAICVETDLSMQELRSRILQPIEAELGRSRSKDKNAPRTIDLDILIFDNEQCDTEIWTHAHIAVPLSEIYPDYPNPKLGKTLAQLAPQLRLTINRSSLNLAD